MLLVVVAVRPRESVTVIVTLIVPDMLSTPVVASLLEYVAPLAWTLYELIELPYEPAAAVWILRVLLPLTNKPPNDSGTLPDGSVSVTAVMLGTMFVGTVPVKLLV
jgi:hypothetical protein